MTAKPMLVAVASALVVAGCATGGFHTMASHQECRGSGVCKVNVLVDDCRISVPDVLDVYGRNRNIHWDIVSSGYEFPDDGVVIQDYDPKREFTDPELLNSKTFKWHDKNSLSRETPYKYSIRVRKGTVLCAPLDPGIINHG